MDETGNTHQTLRFPNPDGSTLGGRGAAALGAGQGSGVGEPVQRRGGQAVGEAGESVAEGGGCQGAAHGRGLGW